jgi:serine/threonine protein kinase/predicted negative regulator of RcsB-dependent stress response
MLDDDNLAGRQIGNYRLSEIIASGTYGSVYIGQHWLFRDELAVAIKVLHSRLDRNEKLEQFRREAYLLRKLKHSSILPLIDAGTHNHIPYMVTPYASGGSLRQVLEEMQGRPVPLDLALWILFQVGEALEYAHSQSVVHRDLKPENVLFGAQGEVFLADFGLAVILEAAQTGFVSSHGTPLYMAPEQFEGLVSPKSDQYALACVGYEMLSGRRPFTPPNLGWETVWFHHAKVAPPPPSQFNPEIPFHIEQALLRALAKDRTERYGSIRAFLKALKASTDILVSLSPISSLPARPSLPETSMTTPTSDSGRLAAIESDGVRQGHSGLRETAKPVEMAVHAIELLDQTPEEYRKQGHAFRDAGVYDRALRAYERAIQLDPSNPLAYYGLAKVFWELQRYEEALAAYDKIVYLQPEDPFFHALRGNALYELQQYPEALAAYDQALAIKQDNASWHARRASILYELGQYVEALHAYDLALALKPEEAYYYACKGDILSAINHEEEALQMYAKAVELDPRESWLHSQKSYIRRDV